MSRQKEENTTYCGCPPLSEYEDGQHKWNIIVSEQGSGHSCTATFTCREGFENDRLTGPVGTASCVSRQNWTYLHNITCKAKVKPTTPNTPGTADTTVLPADKGRRESSLAAVSVTVPIVIVLMAVIMIAVFLIRRRRHLKEISKVTSRIQEGTENIINMYRQENQAHRTGFSDQTSITVTDHYDQIPADRIESGLPGGRIGVNTSANDTENVHIYDHLEQYASTSLDNQYSHIRIQNQTHQNTEISTQNLKPEGQIVNDTKSDHDKEVPDDSAGTKRYEYDHVRADLSISRDSKADDKPTIDKSKKKVLVDEERTGKYGTENQAKPSTTTCLSRQEYIKPEIERGITGEDASVNKATDPNGHESGVEPVYFVLDKSSSM